MQTFNKQVQESNDEIRGLSAKYQNIAKASTDLEMSKRSLEELEHSQRTIEAELESAKRKEKLALERLEEIDGAVRKRQQDVEAQSSTAWEKTSSVYGRYFSDMNC